MSALQKGLLVGVLQLALVLSVAGKYLLDRNTLPRVWAKAAPFDPNLPIRGRYVSLRLEVTLNGTATNPEWQLVRLSGQNDRLTATPADSSTGIFVFRTGDTDRLAEPVAFFIPEHIPDPSFRPKGEELWVEVSVPKKGAPRPIRLGVKKDNVLTPLNLN